MTRSSYAVSEKRRATRRARETSPEYLAIQRERYREAIEEGLCGRCQCRKRQPHRVHCTRCLTFQVKFNQRRDAGKPKRTCRLCHQLGHYSVTCQSGCLVQQRFGKPCLTCAETRQAEAGRSG